MPTRVLGRRTSNNVQKVLWLAQLLALDVAQEDYGGPFGRTREPAYLALNPNGTVPTLVDGDFVLWESNAILRYLAARAASPLYPPEPPRRAPVDQWLDWQLGTLSPAFRPLYVAHIRERRPLDGLAPLVAAAHAQFALLDAALRDRDWIAGAQLTIADIAIGPMVHRWFALGLADAAHAPLARYYGQLAAEPAFQRHVMGVELA